MHPQTVKDSDLIEVVEFAIANQLDQEPTFAWWMRDALRHKNCIVSKVKSCHWKTTHKCGIQLPHSVEEALELDHESNTGYWAKAIAKENKQVKVSWHAMDGATPNDVCNGKVKELTGCQEIKCHMIFDLKTRFTRKASVTMPCAGRGRGPDDQHCGG